MAIKFDAVEAITKIDRAASCGMLDEATQEARFIQDQCRDNFGYILKSHGLSAPDALLVGPARTGTTWLKLVLGDHPDILMASGEPNVLWSAGSGGLCEALRWYARHDIWRGARKPLGLVIEKSPGYICLPDDAIRVLGTLFPKLKVIIGNRSEPERLWSIVTHRMRALKFNGTWKEFCSEHKSEMLGHLNSGRIEIHIARWRNFIDKRNILLYNFNDIIDDPVSVISILLKHIVVRPLDELSNNERFAMINRIHLNPNPGNAGAPPTDLLDVIATSVN